MSIPRGDFALADFEAMSMATELQGLIMDYINDAFFAEEPLNLNNLTWERFMRAHQTAKDGGPLALSTFNRELATLLGPVLQQAMTQPTGATNGNR